MHGGVDVAVIGLSFCFMTRRDRVQDRVSQRMDIFQGVTRLRRPGKRLHKKRQRHEANDK
jgi:hypothetical protein